MTQTLPKSHSTDVKMWLDCGEHGMVPLSRITPTSVVARISKDIPPCDAKLVVTVDGYRMQNRIRLSEGFRKGRRTAVALPIDDIAPF